MDKVDYKTLFEAERDIKDELYSFLISFNLMDAYQIYSRGYRARVPMKEDEAL